VGTDAAGRLQKEEQLDLAYFPALVGAITPKIMSAFSSLSLLSAIALTLSFPHSLSGQVEHKIRNAAIGYGMQQTPRFTVAGPRDKPVGTLRDWLEIEVAMQLDTVSPSGYLEQLDIEFFVAVGDASTRQTVVLNDRLTYLEIDATQRRVHAVAYVSPASLARITGKNNPRQSDISAVAAVITAPGLQTPVEVASAGPRNWWKSEELNRIRGLVLPRSKTPFAHLWWDRYPRDADGEVVSIPTVPVNVVPGTPIVPGVPVVPVVPGKPTVPGVRGVPAVPVMPQ
jgi:hypothetical protein